MINFVLIPITSALSQFEEGRLDEYVVEQLSAGQSVINDKYVLQAFLENKITYDVFERAQPMLKQLPELVKKYSDDLQNSELLLDQVKQQLR